MSDDARGFAIRRAEHPGAPVIELAWQGGWDFEMATLEHAVEAAIAAE